MSNADTLARAMKNLGCTVHHPTLTKSSFYSGRRANYTLEAVVALRSCPNGKGYWELQDPDGKPLLCISFQNRESLIACIASNDFNTLYNNPNFNNEPNLKMLARCFGGVSW